MSGNRLKDSVVYQATVSTEDHHPPQTYVGLTDNSFKTRYSNHKSSFANANFGQVSKSYFLKHNLDISLALLIPQVCIFRQFSVKWRST